MIAALCSLVLVGQAPTAKQVYIDARTSAKKVVSAPLDTIIDKVDATIAEGSVTFHVIFFGAYDPIHPEPGILECHVFTPDEKEYKVALFVMRGFLHHPKLGKVSRGEAVLVNAVGTVKKLIPKITEKNGVTLTVPFTNTKDAKWHLVTRWRPHALAKSFSPNSVWTSFVSEYRSDTSARMYGLPSLLGLLQEIDSK